MSCNCARHDSSACGNVKPVAASAPALGTDSTWRSLEKRFLAEGLDLLTIRFYRGLFYAGALAAVSCQAEALLIEADRLKDTVERLRG